MPGIAEQRSPTNIATFHPFDEATRLVHGTDTWKGHTHAAYGNMNGPFSGITSATMFGAALNAAPPGVQPAAMTANLCAPIRSGPLQVGVHRVRAGKSFCHLAVGMA